MQQVGGGIRIFLIDYMAQFYIQFLPGTGSKLHTFLNCLFQMQAD